MIARLRLLGLLFALILPAVPAMAQCPDWIAGPLDADTAPNGANGTVNCFTLWTPNGTGPAWLVVAGAFTSIQGVAANHIAVRDPATGLWQPLGAGLSFNVFALTVYNNQIVAAGSGN